MLKLSRDEFANYYYSKIAPYLSEFEKKRKNVLLIRNLIMAFTIFIVIFFARALILNSEPGDYIIIFLILILPTIFLAFVICTFVIHMIVKIYQEKLKKNLYKTFFKVLDIDYSNDKTDLDFLKNFISTICEESNIFEYYNHVTIDDALYGNYNGVNYLVADTKITQESSNTHIVVFDGLFLATSLNKNFVNKIVIKIDKFKKHWSDKQKVNLEDVEFKEYFDIYSDDQIEARYIITTAFMERLKNYSLNKEYPIEVVFAKLKGTEQNVFFFFHTHHDHFELPINQRLLNQELFYNVLLELYDMLDIIDALKLEQNIGM